MLLDEVRKVLTRRIVLSMMLHTCTPEVAEFLEKNIKEHPGTTDLLISVKDPDTDYAVRFKSQNRKVEINDPLIQFLQQHEEDIFYSLDKA